MKEFSFTNIARQYEKLSPVQKSAGEILIAMLGIKSGEDVLDIGCGTGNLSKRIRGITKGRIAGIDPSEGMIQKARENCEGLNIGFERSAAEDLGYSGMFDVIFCNSSFQWFRDPEKVIANCRNALKKGGRIGMQAPTKKVYCPNFIEAIERIGKDERTRGIFSHFTNPWYFLETAEEFKSLFEKAGFAVPYSEIKEERSTHTPEGVFNIFSSGAIAGYLNGDCYDVEIGEEYIDAFKDIIRESFEEQADGNGMVELAFYRIFLLAELRQ